jgi:N-acetylmuramoyl-L-alanine amidase
VSFKTADDIRVYTRGDWDARPVNGSYAALGPLRSVVIHHGGPVGAPRMTFKDAAQTCRDWQAYHQNTNGWTDIGYHYLVDGLGRMYRGRPVWAMGAHVLRQNTGRVGINFMQDGRYHRLTEQQRETLIKLFRKKHKALDLPAFADLVNHPGDDWGVFGHRQVPGQATECPGDLIAADLARIIRSFVR